MGRSELLAGMNIDYKFTSLPTEDSEFCNSGAPASLSARHKSFRWHCKRRREWQLGGRGAELAVPLHGLGNICLPTTSESQLIPTAPLGVARRLSEATAGLRYYQLPRQLSHQALVIVRAQVLIKLGPRRQDRAVRCRVYPAGKLRLRASIVITCAQCRSCNIKEHHSC